MPNSHPTLTSLSRDLVLLLWKSNLSVTLMTDKKVAERCVFRWASRPSVLRTADTWLSH